ncbi:MAG: efflux RND transporter periplasmic adaptor subunit [Candidatus Acidiferrum sp.]
MNKTRWIVTAALLIVAAAVVWRWSGRDGTDAESPSRAEAGSGAPAAVARVQRGSLGNTLRIAGEFKPFQDVDIHAKVAGYIRSINVDVGDHVKQGQTIAVLEVPELAAQLSGADAGTRTAQDQIRKAQGDLQRAQSSQSAAHSAYVRLKQAADSRAGLVAQQEVDDSQAKDLESTAQVASAEAELSAAKQQLEVAQANQKQYAALSGYTRITAPFAGVITNRYADTGALIAAGTSSSTQAIPVVRLAEVSVLRLVVPVPESMAAQIRLGEAVKVHVQALDADFDGKVSRFADSLDMQTRTMETEIDVPNRSGRLIPGMYTETELSLREKKNVLTIPLEGVTRNGEVSTVLFVNPQGIVKERRVELGMEDAARVEVLSGLAEGDMVIVGNRSSFRSGEKVQPKDVQSGPENAEGKS